MGKKEIDWEERRYELIKAFTQALLQKEESSNNKLYYSCGIHQDIVHTARLVADEVIKQLKTR